MNFPKHHYGIAEYRLRLRILRSCSFRWREGTGYLEEYHNTQVVWNEPFDSFFPSFTIE